ncbi:hypothetical protein BASA60_003981 [Batrachochytrium salamandrivorans]|nr:hypothetical protein BASA60_003981 [Batrachochytrium salamandrivorans]
MRGSGKRSGDGDRRGDRGGRGGRGGGGANKKIKKDNYKDGSKVSDKTFSVEPGMSGILFSCHRGKEKQSTSEIRKLFTQYAEVLYPEHGKNAVPAVGNDDADDEPVVKSIEDEFSKEIMDLKDHQKTYMFHWEKTSVECLVFMRTTGPVKPVQFVTHVLNDMLVNNLKRTRFTSRIVPLTDTCFANITDMTELAKRITAPYFPTDESESVRYAIIPKSRNNDKIKRDLMIQVVGDLIPSHHKVDLETPQVCIIVEVFKSICGMSVTSDYYRLKRFNIENLDDSITIAGRLASKAASAVDEPVEVVGGTTDTTVEEVVEVEEVEEK